MFESLLELRVMGSNSSEITPEMIQSLNQMIISSVEKESIIPITSLMKGGEDAKFIMILAMHKKIPEC